MAFTAGKGEGRSMKMYESLRLFTIVLIMTTLTQAQEKRQPPSIIPPTVLPDKYLKPQDVIRLPCTATGIPSPSYTWLYNGAELVNDPGIKRLEDGNIEFNMENKREGYYQCKATNKHGTSLSVVIQLQLAEIGTFPGGNQITPVYKSVGESLELHIQGDLHSVPSPVFTWQVINSVDDTSPRELQLSKRVLMSKEGSLYFTHLLREDHKLVKLSAFNNFIDTTKGGRYTQINVNDGNPTQRGPSPLYPKSQSTNVIAVEGEDLELQCIFSGYPLVSIAWQSPNGNSFEKHDENNTLRVNHVTRDHEGRFTCHGENDAGRNQIDINVDVQSRPKFLEGGKPESVIKTEGETASFRCQTTEDTEPAADITWLFNGEPVDVKNPGPRTSITDQNRLLTIIRLDRERDLRVIQCNASNVHGYLFADAVLNILEKTVITEAPESQVLEPNVTHITFYCKITSDPLIPATISWTRDDRPVEDYNDPNMVVANDGRQLNILVNQAPKEERGRYPGQYACNATNGYSSARAVAELESYEDPDEGRVKAAAFPFWIIILLIVIGAILLILILIFACCIYIQRNKGDEYLVDDAERKQGNDPVKELDNMGFHDYQRPEDEVGMMKESTPSLNESMVLGSEGGDSLAEYAEDIGQFKEDGSFIGMYLDEPRKKITVSNA